jgi:hemerythrin
MAMIAITPAVDNSDLRNMGEANMSLVTWDDTMSLGVASLDRQHQQIIGMVNDLHHGMRTGHSRERLGAVLDRMELYVGKHFQYEQILLKMTQFPEAEKHRQMHDDLINEFKQIKKQHGAIASEELTLKTLDLLIMWVVNHIMGDDRKCAQHLVSHGIH